ncbi:hypothetical protein FIV00_15160 [Labrenzia sp. THAF82]|nr:hypothetical protein [Labrenzia sp. THAF82]QFT31830.1 hypothetical protein FIV00_15160 [Labrenzia sp. THAF82]
MADQQVIWAEKQYALEIARLKKMRLLLDEQIAALIELQKQLKQSQG